MSIPVRLICEYIEPEKVGSLITEEVGKGKKYYIEGVFIQCEIKNKNQRVYPLELMKKVIDTYRIESIDTRRALGELGHPATPSINPDRVSHLIESVTQDGNNFIGRAKILDTPNGRIVKSLIDEKVTFGVSSRGAGNVRFTPSGYVVCDDFLLSTLADIVIDPSAPDAFVEAMIEQKQWVLQEGTYVPAELVKVQEVVAEGTKKRAGPARQTLFLEAWDAFLRMSRKTPGSKR